MASTPADVFLDFFHRRNGLIAALTTDLDQFLERCDPEKDCFCLSVDVDNMSWYVTFPPPDALPLQLHKPAPGLYFKRQEIPLSDWLLQIALQGDSWLKSVADHLGARLDDANRNHMFTRLNTYTTVADAVAKNLRLIFGRDESENKEEHKACWSCSGSKESEFWIKCYRCGNWYHGDCMQITPTMAKKIDKYKCPYCVPRG
ncbi:hypothetical protein Scep_014909 [Stephania cephalantha]|uniref:PHD finger protein ALFIN-LIKE n=1 Tax=Stephania cephalantha TaxID=152367 RepID=A0AAP0J426_9MAGN